MANEFSVYSDADLNTLLNAFPDDWVTKGYERMFRQAVMEGLGRTMQFKEDFEGVTAGITAGTTQTQAGGTALTAEINEVSTVANDADAVTLPTAVAGKRCLVVNNGALRLQIFPFLGDDLGEGVDASTFLSPGANAIFYAVDATNWEIPVQITPVITAGAGTGFTLNNAGYSSRSIYKCTLDYTGLAAAGLTADHTIATIPAKMKITGMIADTTVPYTGGGVTAATLQVGIAAGDLDAFLVDHDVLSAAVVRGTADAELGVQLIRATAVSGGYMEATFALTTAVSVRLTTVTANTDQLTAGSTTYYIVCDKFP